MTSTRDIIPRDPVTDEIDREWLAGLPPDRSVTRRFPNNVVGRRCAFQFLNDSQGDRLKIKKVRIYAVIAGDVQIGK